MPPLPASDQRPPPATLCLPGDPGTAPYVLPASGRAATSTPNQASPQNTSNPARAIQDSPLYLLGTQSTRPFHPTNTGTDAVGSEPATEQSATTGARLCQKASPWISAAQNTMAPFSITTNAAHHGQAAKAGQAFETAHEEMSPFWMVAPAPRRDAQPPDHAEEYPFRRTHQYPEDGLPAARTSAPTGNPSTGAKRKASDAPTQGTKRSRTHEATATGSATQFGTLPHPAADFAGVGLADDSDPLSVLTWSDAPANATAMDALSDCFLQDMNALFADAPYGGALPFPNGFSAQPILQSTSVPTARSAQGARTPAQSIVAAKARVGTDAMSTTQGVGDYALDDLFLPDIQLLFADMPVDGALPIPGGFSAQPLPQSTSVPPEKSAQRALTPAQLIAAAKARLDKDAMGGDLPLLLLGWTPTRASDAEADAAFATGSGSGAVEMTPEIKRCVHEAEAEILRALEIAPPKDSGPMEQRMIVCTYVDLVVFGGRPVMMSAHLDAQINNTIVPHGQLQVPQAGQSAYLKKIAAAKQENAAKFQSTKRGRATQLVQELQYEDGELLLFCELCRTETLQGRLPRPFKNEAGLVKHYASKHLD